MRRTDLWGTGMGLCTTWKCSNIENLMFQLLWRFIPQKGKMPLYESMQPTCAEPYTQLSISPRTCTQRWEHFTSKYASLMNNKQSKRSCENPQRIRRQFLADWISATCTRRCDPSLALAITGQVLGAVKRHKAQSLCYQLMLQWTHHTSGGLQSRYPPYLPTSLYF